MHKHSCAHRDLKPANVLLTWDSFGRITALVSDLGWARQMPPSCGGSGGAPEPAAKEPGGPDDCPIHPVLTPGCCTWPYRAPEVELGMPYSLSLDIWSMGIVFEELFSGECFVRGPRPAKERRVPLLRWIESLRGQIHEKTWPEVAGLSRLAAYRQSVAFDPLATATPFSAWEVKADAVTRDLCLVMTRLQPSERLRAQDVLAHPLLSSAASGSSPERAAPGGGAPKPAAQGPKPAAQGPGGGAPKPAAQGPRVFAADIQGGGSEGRGESVPVACGRGACGWGACGWGADVAKTQASAQASSQDRGQRAPPERSSPPH